MVFVGKVWPKTATTQQDRCILPQGALNFCSFSPTDVKAITAARDGTVKVWEFEEGIEGGELELRTESGNAPSKPRWWFQIFFIFIPIRGDDPI